MNTFTESENAAAHQLYLDACALNMMAREKIGEYANPEDREAATIALLMRALELAGGKDFINLGVNLNETAD